MNITEITVGDNILVQPSESIKEVAKVMAVNLSANVVIVKFSNERIGCVTPKQILKSFV